MGKKSNATVTQDTELMELREAMGRDLLTPESLFPRLNEIVVAHPDMRGVVESVWGMVEAMHQQQGRALALLTAVKAALAEANNQLTNRLIDDAEMMARLWEAGDEHGRGALRQETIDLITGLIDRDEAVVARAINIFFDGGILDEFAVDSLDDLILHISTDLRIAEANNFEPVEWEGEDE